MYIEKLEQNYIEKLKQNYIC